MKLVLIIFNFIFVFATIYEFKSNNFFNKQIDFKDFKDSVLVVFVSYDDCKLTNELQSLNNLHQKYKNKNINFIGLAIKKIEDNNKKFCSINYGVDFDMFDKYNNKKVELLTYANSLYLNKAIKAYNPIIIYNKKIIRLDDDVNKLDKTLSFIIKELK